MIQRLKSRRIVLTDGLFDGYVYIENGLIAAVTAEERPFDAETDYGDLYLAPGFVDLHVHGGVGFDFGGCTAQQADAAARYHLQHGTTALLATLAAAPSDALQAVILRLKACQAANLRGVHLEGPYLASAQCGAQNTDHITQPQQAEYERLLASCGDSIKRWTYAPERDENGAFCKAVHEAGILPSAGHTDAVGADMQTAFENGCRLVTHLYSCTSTVTRDGGFRRMGAVEYAYLCDDMAVELIADGCHLPPEFIQMIVKIKGRDRVTLTTDALSVTGCDAKTGELNGVPYIVEDGVCKLIDRLAFAGSIATADRLVRTCVQQAGLSVVDSVYMASTVPAALMGWNTGRIEAGYAADIAVFDDVMDVQAVYVNGLKEI